MAIITRKKLPSISSLEKRAHKLLREIAIHRDGGKCICCGSDRSLQGGHVIPAHSCAATRYDILNVVCQCRTCNHSHQYSPHKLILAYINRYGVDAFKDLCSRATPGTKHKRADLNRIIDSLNIWLDNIEAVARG